MLYSSSSSDDEDDEPAPPTNALQRDDPIRRIFPFLELPRELRDMVYNALPMPDSLRHYCRLDPTDPGKARTTRTYYQFKWLGRVYITYHRSRFKANRDLFEFVPLHHFVQLLRDDEGCSRVLRRDP